MYVKLNEIIAIGCCVVCLLFSNDVRGQNAYFIDGYHGGVYGHYPEGQTAFILEKLNSHPKWSINLEIEPETWDVVKERDPEAYEELGKIFRDQSTENGRIEYVNPTYAQSYLFNTSGESVIRQFSYGIELLREHFPEAVFTTYSAEEPCFTSCLPQVLKSFGYSYASTKNPNTMWGGYTRAYGGELVNWVGPDGTKILTVSRYACEDLQPNSTWQSIAWVNSGDYIRKCRESGIKNPVGMCIQDAAWKSGWGKGPWLGYDKPDIYKTWRNYIENFSVGSTDDDWYFSQEDVQVSLMWGSQVIQKLAQEVRTAENRIVMCEKLAVLSSVYGGDSWPGETLDEAWKKLLLAQHHDCWITPYNRLQRGRTWAEAASKWTETAGTACDTIVKNVTEKLAPPGETGVTVFNTLAFKRNEPVEIEVPSEWKGKSLNLIGPDEKNVSAQIIDRNEKTYLIFIAEVPPLGFSNYKIVQKTEESPNPLSAKELKNGCFEIYNEFYTIILDPEKGGSIRSIKSKKAGDKEFVDAGNERSFNEVRGYFYKDEKFLSSVQSSAKIEILENGPVSVKLAVHGNIGPHPFVQTIRLMQGEKRIDMSLRIDYRGNPGIGEPGQRFDSRDRKKPFYDNRYKLLVHFPCDFGSRRKIYKNAPFDVCESGHEETFFNSWDDIKHDIILNWVDLYDKDANRGLNLFSDHTTSYAHGMDHPLALTVQYSGGGLWGRDHTITGPSEIRYAIVPHEGDWAKSRSWSEGERINEPLLGVLSDYKAVNGKSLVQIENDAFELSAAFRKGDDLYFRFFNPQGDEAPKSVNFDLESARIELVELNGEVKELLKISKANGSNKIDLSIPKFGIRTIRISDPQN